MRFHQIRRKRAPEEGKNAEEYPLVDPFAHPIQIGKLYTIGSRGPGAVKRTFYDKGQAETEGRITIGAQKNVEEMKMGNWHAMIIDY